MTGNFALAFMMNNIINTITAHTKDKASLPKNVGYGYLIGGLFYFFVGIMGSVGILGRESKVDFANRQKIMDYFPVEAWQPILVEITFILNMFTSIPVFHNTAKKQFLLLVFKR